MYRFLVNLCLVAFHLSSNSLEASPVDGDVLFDSSYLHQFKMPASCAGQSFCFEKGDQYPKSKIENLLDDMPVSLNARIGTSFSFRDGDNPDCPANTTFINKPIYYILDNNDKVRVVAQSPERFQQIYSAKWCQRPGKITVDTPHFLKNSPTLQKYRIECVNTYMDFEFLVLTDDYFEPKLELVSPKGGIPVCCRCKYSEIGV